MKVELHGCALEALGNGNCEEFGGRGGKDR